MILNTNEFTTPLEETSPQELNKRIERFFICRQEKVTTTAVRSSCAKTVIIGNSKRVKNHHFCAQLSHCLSIY